jgi:tetratricopeptide (TPR) repeat protein
MADRAAALRARVDAYRTGSDSDGILLEDVARDAEQLYRTGGDAPQVLALLAEFHWCRYQAAQQPEDLATAVELADRLATAHPELRPAELGHALDTLDRVTAGADPALDPDDDHRLAWAALFFSLCLVWTTDPPTTDGAVLDRLVAAMSLVVSLTPDGHGVKRNAMSLLGSYLRQRGRETGRRDDIDAAIAVSREALRRTPVDDPQRPAQRRLVLGTLLAAYEQDGSTAARVALAKALIEGIAETGSTDADLNDLGWSIASAEPRSGERVDTEQAVTLARLGVAARQAGDPERPAALFALAAALSDRAGERQSVSDSTAAVAAMREMADLLEAHPPRSGAPDSGDATARRGIALTFLSRYLQQRYELTGDAAAMREAASVARTARDLLPAGHPVHTLNLVYLGGILFALHEQNGDPASLDEAAEVLRAALAEDGSGPDAARGLSLLSAVHYTRFRLTGTPADLERSVALGRQAVSATAADDPNLPDWLANFSNALRLRYAQGGGLADLDAAVDAARQAVDRTPAEHADRSKFCQVLGGVLLDRYQATGDAGNLDDAVAAMRESEHRAGRGTLVSALAQSSLSVALTVRYQRQGSAADLDEAIALLRPAMNGLIDSAVELPTGLNNLATALALRFGLTGSTVDLDDSIAVSRQALQASEPGSASGITARINLGNALTSRFRMQERGEDIDEAISVLRAARAGVGSAERPSVFVNLANALSARYDRLGTPIDLDDAIGAARSALDSAPAGGVRRARYHNALGALLMNRFQRTGERDDLDAAVTALTAAEGETGGQNPDRAAQLYNLSDALLHRSALGPAGSDRDAALRAAREAAGVDTAPAQVRTRAAQRWAAIAAEDGDFAEAVHGYELAVTLLPVLSWRGLTRDDQERQLSEFSGLSSDAAAAAIGAGHPELAVELLEQGRTVLWSQRLDTHTDLTALRETRPDLAQRVSEVRAALDRHVDPAGSGPTERVETDLAPLAREWDRLVAEVRTLPGFADFLRPRPFAALAEAAANGPVAIINVSRLRCDALLVAGGAVRIVPLPELSIKALTERLDTLYAAFASRPNGLGEVVANHQMVAGLLEWLWTAVVGPVLDRVADTARVWWCPTGYLALLPLHAATDHRTGESALDRVVSSYTPTLRALMRARGVGAARTAEPADVLVVAVPHTPGADDLNVQPEVDAIVGRAGARCTVLTGPDATLDRVRDHLPRHPWVHFACHGTQNLSDPSRSALLLHDGPLAVLDVARLELPDAELAFLSACQTAGGGAVLADEAIHLAAALHVNGFRQVVATLWPIYDAIAPEVADQVYAGLAAGSTADAGPLLHDAVRALRDGHGSGLPAVWAPYIHIGP